MGQECQGRPWGEGLQHVAPTVTPAAPQASRRGALGSPNGEGQVLQRGKPSLLGGGSFGAAGNTPPGFRGGLSPLHPMQAGLPLRGQSKLEALLAAGGRGASRAALSRAEQSRGSLQRRRSLWQEGSPLLFRGGGSRPSLGPAGLGGLWRSGKTSPKLPVSAFLFLAEIPPISICPHQPGFLSMPRRTLSPPPFLSNHPVCPPGTAGPPWSPPSACSSTWPSSAWPPTLASSCSTG